MDIRLNIIESKNINVEEFKNISKEEKYHKFIDCNFYQCKIKDLEIQNMIFENCNME